MMTFVLFCLNRSPAHTPGPRKGGVMIEMAGKSKPSNVISWTFSSWITTSTPGGKGCAASHARYGNLKTMSPDGGQATSV